MRIGIVLNYRTAVIIKSELRTVSGIKQVLITLIISISYFIRFTLASQISLKSQHL